MFYIFVFFSFLFTTRTIQFCLNIQFYCDYALFVFSCCDCCLLLSAHLVTVAAVVACLTAVKFKYLLDEHISVITQRDYLCSVISLRFFVYKQKHSIKAVKCQSVFRREIKDFFYCCSFIKIKNLYVSIGQEKTE